MSEKKDEIQDWMVGSFDDGSIRGKAVFSERGKYSVIAMNLETVEDVEKVIHQCELIRQEITGGCEKWDFKRSGEYISQKNR